MEHINLIKNSYEAPKFLKDTRAKLGFTQKQIAEQIGITRDSIANYETGRLKTPLDVYLKIQDLLNQKDISPGG